MRKSEVGLRIRTATSADAAAVAAIYAPYVLQTSISFEVEPPSSSEMASRIERIAAQYPYLVAELDGQVVGFAYANQLRSRAAYDASVEVTAYVDTVHHRLGVGRALYIRLLMILAEQGRHAAFACITLPNEASVALHEACGFEAVGVWREAGRKFDHWLDVGWWQKILAPPNSSLNDSRTANSV